VSGTTVLWLVPITFGLTMLWAPTLIRALRRLNFGKQIRLDGPSSHQRKAGTPTMGGWLFIVTPAVTALAFASPRAAVVVPVVAMLLFGTAGALDDFANLRSKEGLGFRVRYKFIWHGLMALALALWLFLSSDVRFQHLPGGATVNLGVWCVPLAALAIFCTAAGVNEVDGLDGLAGGTNLIAFGSYLVLALASGLAGPAALAAAVVGGLAGFLWHNVHPARVFMGDTGALALGAGLAVLALQTHWVFLLPVVGLVFVIDLLSVILQVGYFRLTHGKRLFRMSPIHHGLELSGWPESLVVQRFWLLGVLAGTVGVALASLG
jgi:phospho-N-acetylmuramoyl-pentapeptide-transferase